VVVGVVQQRRLDPLRVTLACSLGAGMSIPQRLVVRVRLAERWRGVQQLAIGCTNRRCA
jgi:hypothetical protein